MTTQQMLRTLDPDHKKGDVLDTKEIGTELVSLCRHGKNQETIDKFYSPNIVRVEALAMPNIGQTQKDIEAIKAKNTWLGENHEMYGGQIDGPFLNGNQFIGHFKYDVMPKRTGKRMRMNEMDLFAVENEKLIKAEFFSHMG